MYDERKCCGHGCTKHYCEQHYELETVACKVCCDHSYAARRLGATNGHVEARFCRAHPMTRCTRRVSPYGEEDAGEDDGSEDSDWEVCGFLCCKRCLHDHKCGDDPTLYL